MIDFNFLNPDYKEDIINIIFLTNNSKYMSLPSIQRGQYRFSPQAIYNRYQYIPPSSELYVQYSLQTYFISFFGILFIQSSTIFLTDMAWVKNIPKSTSIWKRIVHAIQKSHFPFPFTNWHEANGNCNDHLKRKKAVQKEFILTSLVNLFFNMIMLVPLAILCKSFSNLESNINTYIAKWQLSWFYILNQITES